MITGDAQIALLSRVLDVATLRHRVIAHNVANVNTPNFKRHDVDFADAFAQALGENNFDAALQVTPRVVEKGGGDLRHDGNNVDIDLELGQLHQNSLLFQVFNQILASRLGQMRSAITGR